MKRALIASALSLAAVSAVHAEVGVGLVGGSLGAGAYVGIKANDYVSLRLQGTKWNISQTRNVDGIDYDVSLDLGAIGGYVDFYPFQGTFRVSLGLTKSLLDAQVSNASTQTANIGNVSVTVNPGEVSGRATFDTAPYLGIGWGQVAPKGWGFRFDLGAHFLGKPNVDLNVTGNARTQLNAAAALIGSTGDAEIAREEQNARDRIGDVIYPEVSLAVTYGW